MATKQQIAAKKNIKKAQARWQHMTHRQRALAQPEGRARKRPGTTGQGDFFHIEVRPKGNFQTFRIQDVGKKGGLERLAGRRSSGSWDTVSWLISKKDARVVNDQLFVTNARAKSLLKNLRGPIIHVKGDIFKAYPRANIPEKMKSTPAMKKAQKANILKAQAVRRKLSAGGK